MPGESLNEVLAGPRNARLTYGGISMLSGCIFATFPQTEDEAMYQGGEPLNATYYLVIAKVDKCLL